MTAKPRPHLLSGRKVAAELRREVATAVAELTGSGRRPPQLAAVLVGEDPASESYVAGKARACGEAGIASRVLRLPAATEQAELSRRLRELNDDPAVDGILVQLPLPPHLPRRAILEQVRPDKDVDGFHPANVGRLWLAEPGAPLETLTPATPTGVLELLRRSRIELAGRRAVVVGRSAIVGKPMAALLLRENATVTLCHSRTRDLPAICRRADVLIAAVGRPAMIGPEHVGDGAVVIDVGINRIDDPELLERLHPGDAKRARRFAKRGYALVGDVDFHRVAPRAAAVTPVPGGVGPLTIAQLLVNTLAAYRQREGLGEAG